MPARRETAEQKLARGSVLAFLDCDCQAEPAWLAEGMKALAQAHFVGGRVKVLVDDETKLTAAEAFEREFAFDIQSYVEKKHFAVTADLFCPRAIFNPGVRAIWGGFFPRTKTGAFAHGMRASALDTLLRQSSVIQHAGRGTNWR